MNFIIKVYQKPGRILPDESIDALARDIREIAGDCFHALPHYQAIVGTRSALSDKLITLARDKNGTPQGFCSMVFLDIEDVGRILHLGLTCVRPEARGKRLTHLLVKKALTEYLLKQNPFGKIWISNCAGVLSSLGNVAMHFEQVFPSPFYTNCPGATHLKIARAINDRFRQEMYVRPDAVLDEETFVFQGSVKDTVFHKEKNDLAYHHRKNGLNRFYANMMNFEQGDEVLQVGYFRMVSVVKYILRQHRMKQLNRQQEHPALGL
ncbi:hypothetical protein [Desulfobacter sp.]|uniref:hypothetical protein n=1 Tax=Desulfobacter sp. TaxID=2294 RepID=UPI003D13A676